VRVISEHMRSKYRPIQVDEDSVRTMLQTGYECVSDAWREILEMPIATEELKAAAFKGNSKKSPGRDGIGLEFFKVLRDDVAGDMRTVFTQMLRDWQLTERQKQSHSVHHEKRRASYTCEL